MGDKGKESDVGLDNMLGPKLHGLVAEEATRTKVTMGEVIRLAVIAYFGTDQSPQTPAAVMGANEDFIRALEHNASEEVINQHIGTNLRALTNKYLFLCQMLALHTKPSQRAVWNVQFIQILAEKLGGLGGDDPGE